MLPITNALVGVLFIVSIISMIAGTAGQSATPNPAIEVTKATDVASRACDRRLNEQGRNVRGLLVLQTVRRQLEALKC
jgi:hypothetical protein